MPRHFSGKILVVASHNKGKVQEICDLLAPFGVETVSAGDLGLAEPEETGETFRANAELKALAAAKAAGQPALADDSGLCVDALSGAPGIHSARWAGPTKDFDFAMERVRLGLVEEGTWTRAPIHLRPCARLAHGHVEYSRAASMANLSGRRAERRASATIDVVPRAMTGPR